jgi:ATP-dependent Lon protease
MNNENQYEIRINEMIDTNPGDNDLDFIPLISDEDDDPAKLAEYPDILPILPLKNTVLFPGVLIPITVGRQKSLKLIRDAYEGNRIIGTIAQKDSNIEEPKFSDLYKVGTIAQILRILEMPDGGTSVIIQGKSRFEVEKQMTEKPYFKAKIKIKTDIRPVKGDKEFEAIIGSLKDLSIKIIQLSINMPQEAMFAVKNIESTSFLINFVSSNSAINTPDKQKLIEYDDMKIRAMKLMEHLGKEVQMLELKNDIQSKVKFELDQQQREYMLQQQIKTIQDELGGNPVDQEVEDLQKKAKKKKWSKSVSDTFNKEIEKLERLNPAAAEYSLQLNYLQLLLELPWNEYTKDSFDLQRAQKVLDEDHFGLEKVKERIIEHLAVLKLKGDMKAPIICLFGPPGVGKTSLGKSVAKALKRKYIRMSLGGLHDESEIRGHRKTYIGAMPGRIIQNLKKVHSSNPVFVLDEIDKVGNDFRGDPSSALLEVLDPEQNSTFYDNFLEIEYDLSKAMFIATANSISSIHPALRDRMEMIEVSGYIIEEKIEISKRHLVPKQLEAHGVKKNQLTFKSDVLEFIIENYTRESGVRELDQRLAKITRSIAKKIALEESYNKTPDKTEISKILGPPIYLRDKYEGNEFAGVVTGLAWTSAGGEILYIETSLSRGKDKRLTITGNLGDVMKESAVIAMEYLKSHCSMLDINPEIFDNWNVHVHVPEGAIPKDGPSAGITMATSLASAFTQRKVRNNLAMTGEITLRGRVLPVGGIKEKILAAKRAGITDIIISEDNRKDINEINEIYIKGLTFHYVREIIEVFKLALLDEKVKNALDFTEKPKETKI